MTRSPDHLEATESIAIDASVARPLGGRYRLIEVVGRGGMGSVYRGLDLRLNRPVAIKVLRSIERADTDRFEAEIKILERLAHPDLVRLLDAGDLASRPFLVMDLVQGRSLAERAAEGPLDREETARIGARVAAALAFVHDAGVIHRDVKPANVLLTEGGDVFLADFGIARLIDSTSITVTDRPLGTPAYLSPEQVEGSRVGPSTDVYSLGLVLIECLSGRRAFEGEPSEIAGERLRHDPAIPFEVGEGWRQILAGMTRRSPAERPSASDVVAQLGALARVDAYLAAITEPWPDAPATSPHRGDPPDSRGATTQTVAALAHVGTRRERARRAGSDQARRVTRRTVRSVCVGGLTIALTAGLVMLAATKRPVNPTKEALRSHALSPAVARSGSSTSPTLSATSVQVESAAAALDAVITRGEGDATIDAALGRALSDAVGPLLTSSLVLQPQRQAQQFNYVLQQYLRGVQDHQIVGGATIRAMATAIDRLATAMG